MRQPTANRSKGFRAALKRSTPTAEAAHYKITTYDRLYVVIANGPDSIESGGDTETRISNSETAARKIIKVVALDQKVRSCEILLYDN